MSAFNIEFQNPKYGI